MKNSLWKYVPLEQGVNILDTVRQPINRKERMKRIENKEILYPYYGATGQVDYIDDYLLDGEYVLLGEDGAPFLNPLENKAYIVNGKFWVNNHAHILQSKTNNKFLCYYLNTVNYKGLVTGTTRYKLTQAAMKRIIVPVPPLPEQERIVAHIEELFSELDSGVETLKKTKAQLDVHRQAVLKETFEDTRFSRIVELSEVVDEIHIGPFGTMLHKHDYIQNGIPVINPTHLQDGNIISDSKNTISTRKAEELSSYKLQGNDILLGRRGEMGRCAPVTSKEIGWICGTGNIIIRLKKEFSATFYTKILSNPHTVAFLEKHANGTTMKNLNEKIVKRIPVPYITREQQKGIENEIESRLSVCNNIEQTIDATLEQAKALRHSILKETFEGGPFDEKTATNVRN